MRVPPVKRRRPDSPPDVALQRLGRIPPRDRPATRVLDIPCGDGVAALPLALAGFEVAAADLFPETAQAVFAAYAAEPNAALLRGYWRGRPPPLVRELLAAPPPLPDQRLRLARADMQQPLPFPSGAFDIALTLEGIEHIDAPTALLAELRRVLAPGGRLLVSTPNLLCLRSRLAFALTGQRTLRTALDEVTGVAGRDGDRLYHGHVFLLTYFQMRYLLHAAGFRIGAVLPSRFTLSSLLLTPLLGLPVLLAARRPRHAAGSPRQREIRGEILRHLRSPALLWGANLILEAVAV